MKHLGKRIAALGLTGAMALSMAACGGSSDSTTESASPEQASAASTTSGDSGEVTTITLYPRDANLTSGVVTGYVGDYFASKGLSIDVWAYSDEKTNAILASGDLPDLSRTWTP